jgi:PTS system galactitol-specific IIA component
MWKTFLSMKPFKTVKRSFASWGDCYVKDTYVQAVLDREKEFPTGLQTTLLGCAIPHTDTIHVFRSSIAVATLTSPVIFQAMGDPGVDIKVTLVMMLAISDVNMVINTLTKVISILEYESSLCKIMGATRREEIQEIMRDHLQKISEKNAASAVGTNIGH